MKYDAFISYRHGGIDEAIAKNLHSILEKFVLPSSIKKGNGKKRIDRVFLDNEELPLSSDLGNSIEEAINESEWLIVICSPRLPESKWCLKEIETFIKLRGPDKVLAVLVEGEPFESFPEQLLHHKVKKIDFKGNEVELIEAIEPLAADVRAENEKQAKKKLKKERYRILAPMFGLDFNDLKRRERERALKRIIALSLGISLIVAIVALFSTMMLLKIHDQNEAMKYTLAETTALKAIDYLNSDLRELSLSTAYSALTSLEGVNMPYTAYGEYALASALGVYDHNREHIAVSRSYQVNGRVQGIEASPNNKYLAIAAEEGYANTFIYIVDLDNEIIFDVIEGEEFSTFEEMIFIDDHRLAVNYWDSVSMYSIGNDDIECLYEVPTNAEAYTLSYIQDKDVITLNSPYEAIAIRAEDGVYTSITNEGNDNVICGSSEDGLYLIKMDLGTGVITQYDTITGEQIGVQNAPYIGKPEDSHPYNFSSIVYEDTTVYFYSKSDNSYLHTDTFGFSISNSSGEVLWSEEYSLFVKEFSRINGTSCIVGGSSYTAYAIDLSSGYLRDQASFEGSCAIVYDSGAEVAVCFSTTGTRIVWSYEVGFVEYEGTGIDYHRPNMRDIDIASDDYRKYYYVNPQNDNRVFVYQDNIVDNIEYVSSEGIRSGKKEGELFSYEDAIEFASENNIVDSYFINHILVVGEEDMAFAIGENSIFTINLDDEEIVFELDRLPNESLCYLTGEYAITDDRIIVFNYGGAFAFNMDGELVAVLYGACDYDKSSGEIIYKPYGDDCYSCPLLSLEELLEEAELRFDNEEDDN